jgi:hypothetical protein
MHPYMCMVKDGKLVDAEGLINVLWDSACKPGLRTIRRWQQRKLIPYIRVGRLVFFDPPAVRQALDKRK